MVRGRIRNCLVDFASFAAHATLGCCASNPPVDKLLLVRLLRALLDIMMAIQVISSMNTHLHLFYTSYNLCTLQNPGKVCTTYLLRKLFTTTPHTPITHTSIHILSRTKIPFPSVQLHLCKRVGGGGVLLIHPLLRVRRAEINLAAPLPSRILCGGRECPQEYRYRFVQNQLAPPAKLMRCYPSASSPNFFSNRERARDIEERKEKN